MAKSQKSQREKVIDSWKGGPPRLTGSALKLIRTDMGLSQPQLALKLGIDRGGQTISEWERGVYEIPPYLSFAIMWIQRHGQGS